MTYIYILIISFSLGLFKNELVTLFNKLLTLFNIKLSNKIMNYFHVFTNTFSLLFKYLFYFYITYKLFSFIIIYIDYKYVLSNFDDLVNLSNNEYNIINNNTTNIYSVDKAVEQLPRAIATYGAYKAGMSVAKNAPTLSGKIVTAALVAGTTAGAVSFGTVLGENLAKDMFKNKFLFTMVTLIPNHSHLNIYPYNLLPDMYLMNSCCIGFFVVIFNIILVEYIKPVNILSYLPSIIKHSRIYFLIEFFFNRYITIWNKSKKPILIVSLICIIINLSLIQLGLYIIIHHNPT